jgi:hypothetical protein
MNSLLYFLLFNQKRVLGGVYISVPEQIPPPFNLFSAEFVIKNIDSPRKRIQKTSQLP